MSRILGQLEHSDTGYTEKTNALLDLRMPDRKAFRKLLRKLQRSKVENEIELQSENVTLKLVLNMDTKSCKAMSEGLAEKYEKKALVLSFKSGGVKIIASELSFAPAKG
jgi:hypothetical protein